MLCATRFAVNADPSLLPHLSRHPKLIGRSIVFSTVRVSRARRGLTSPRWRRCPLLLPNGQDPLLPSGADGHRLRSSFQAVINRLSLSDRQLERLVILVEM